MPGVSSATVGSAEAVTGATERSVGQKLVRVVLHRRHPVPGEQVRKQPHHDLAVFQHVGHAGRRARIVLQHVEFFRIDPDDVDAGDVHIDVVRHVLAVHLGPEHRVLVDQVFRDDPGAQDVARMIDVGQEQVQRLDPLLQSLLEDRPFLGRDDARDDVERDQPFLRLGVAIDREGDADPPEQQLGFLAPILQGVRRRVLQPEREFLVGLTETAVGLVHLIERNCHEPSDTSPKRFRTLKVEGSKAMVARGGPARYALIDELLVSGPEGRCHKNGRWLAACAGISLRCEADRPRPAVEGV